MLPAELHCPKKEEERGGAEGDTSYSPSPANSTAPSLPECAGAEQNSCLHVPQGSGRRNEASWIALVLVCGRLKPSGEDRAEDGPRHLTATPASGPG